MIDEIHKDVGLLNKAVFGDRDNHKFSPGIIAEQTRMSMEQARTNEILLELRNSVMWINRLIISGIITGIIGIVIKILGHP